MARNPLTPAARRENTETLKAVLGLEERDAASFLDFHVSISAEQGDATARLVAGEVAEMLGRTVRQVSLGNDGTPTSLELVIGNATPVGTAPKLYLTIGAERAVLGTAPSAARSSHAVPRIVALLIACYSCAAVVFHSTGGKLPLELSDPFEFCYGELGVDLGSINAPFNIERAYLAGAGAIGNGLLWALRYLNVQGELHIVDDDTVSSGNLNRQIWFEERDIGHRKVEVLAAKAQPMMTGLTLVPRYMRVQSLPERSAAWLTRLLVAVDSRRARRELQNEFPGEVFDASTTDIREVVLHYHRQPTQHACMSCIYEPDREELRREQHIADHLGVSIDDIRTERISANAASSIARRFNLNADEIAGTAYDSLFKALCAQQRLGTVADKRAVASFAFVSVLAGALLAIELYRRVGTAPASTDFNYWRVSPWHTPIGRRRTLRPRQAGCPFCGNPLLGLVSDKLWST